MPPTGVSFRTFVRRPWVAVAPDASRGINLGKRHDRRHGLSPRMCDVMWSGRRTLRMRRDSSSPVRQGTDHGNAQENPREKQKPRHDCLVHIILQSSGCVGPEGSISPQPIGHPFGRGESEAITVPAAATGAGHVRPQPQLLAVAGKSEARERLAACAAATHACLRSALGGCETIQRRRKSDPGHPSAKETKPRRGGRSWKTLSTIHR